MPYKISHGYVVDKPERKSGYDDFLKLRAVGISKKG